MKRVYCLYRVSTKKQADRNDKNENDIPLQRTVCCDFVSYQKYWEIIKEYSEIGVSGLYIGGKFKFISKYLDYPMEQVKKLGYYDDDMKFITGSGEFEIFVRSNSAECLSKCVYLKF